MKPLILPLLIVATLVATAEIVSVDVNAWAATGTGETNGWTVSGIDSYSGEKGARFDNQYDQSVSPLFPGIVTQLVMSVRASSTDTKRFLTAVPVAANTGASELPAQATKTYESQVLAWQPEDGVRQFLFKNVGTGVAGWGIRSLDVYIDRGIEPPTDLSSGNRYSDALTVGWEPDARAVLNELEVCQVITIAPRYDLLREWDFTSLTNLSGNSKTILELNPPEALNDVEGTVLGLQQYDGGHLQIGNTKVGGMMLLPLTQKNGRMALLEMLRSDKDGNFSALIGCVGSDGLTNECARILLKPEADTSFVLIPDEAEVLIIQSEKGDNRIRVENVKIVTDYVSGCTITNSVLSRRTRKDTCEVRNLVPGDFIWRVRSFGSDGTESAWSKYAFVTIDPACPNRPVPGFAVLVR